MQWDVESIDEFDSLINFEKLLEDRLHSPHSVDGHDCGSGEGNIFIITLDLKDCLEKIMLTTEAEGQLDRVKIGYRKVGDESYSVYWPEDLDEIKVI